MRLAVLLLVVAGLSSACVVRVRPRHAAVAVVEVPVAPPPPRAEVIPPPSGPDLVWVPGHWAWNGRAHHWVGGHYRRAPQRGHQWVPGHWEKRGRHWVWIDGRWRR